MSTRDEYERVVLRIIAGMPRETISDHVQRLGVYLYAMWNFDHDPPSDSRRFSSSTS
jgi:hypothetical protein